MTQARLYTPLAALAGACLLAGMPLEAAQASAPLTGTAAGIGWTVPETWSQGKGSSMRVATYEVPGAEGAEGGQCAVFFFGRTQGGSVEANVQRWSRQFKENPTPRRSERTVDGVGITLVDLEGTYLNPGGGTMQSRGESPNHRLLGAIVEAPGGRVFFKFTGPKATVAAAQGDFDALIGSIRKGQ